MEIFNDTFEADTFQVGGFTNSLHRRTSRVDNKSPVSAPTSPIKTKKHLGASGDVPKLILATPDSTAHTTRGSDHLSEDSTEEITSNSEEFLKSISVPPLMLEKRSDTKTLPVPPRPGPHHPLLMLRRQESTDSSVYFSSTEAEEVDAKQPPASSASTFACLNEFADDVSSHSTSSSSSSSSDSDSSIMSSESSSSSSMISTSSFDIADNGTNGFDESMLAGQITSIFGSLNPSGPSSNASEGADLKKASMAWLHRRERMEAKKISVKKLSRKQKSKLRSRDNFLKKMAMKGESDYRYLKENEIRARTVTRGTNDTTSKGTYQEVRRHILFEVLYTIPAAMTMLIFCATHVAIYEFFQIAVADCLDLNEYYNQTLVYICVFFVAILLARISGSLYEFTSDESYNKIKFDMHNKLLFGDPDARILRWLKKHPTAKLLLDVSSLYLTYLSGNHFLTETMMKTFFDNKEHVLENLPSMKYYPGISTHISNILLHGEVMFEDPSSVLGSEQVPAASSTACAILGGDLCDERVFQACSALDEFRANLTVADGEYLYDEVSFNTYYKIIGDLSAGIYYYETAMAALLVCAIFGSIYLRKHGVGFWDM